MENDKYPGKRFVIAIMTIYIDLLIVIDHPFLTVRSILSKPQIYTCKLKISAVSA